MEEGLPTGETKAKMQDSQDKNAGRLVAYQTTNDHSVQYQSESESVQLSNKEPRSNFYTVVNFNLQKKPIKEHI